MPSDLLIEAAERVLAGKKCQLWAHLNIASPEDRKAAALWLAQQVTGVLIEKASPGSAWVDLGLSGGKR